ncbi:MAG: dihydrofolate reductase [Bdellovibrionales bacterium]|nr:dihydrofolate reductase [Oligoflexia bacterium]
MKIIAIAAVAANGVMGKGGELPWTIPEDMLFFRESTRGQVVLMGRKTYQSLGKALPKRENGIITRDLGFVATDARVFHSFKAGVEWYRAQPELSDKVLFVIGGAEIYALSRAYLDEVWLTEIEAEIAGNVFFPDYAGGALHWNEFDGFKLKDQNDFESSPFRYRFTRFVRRV